MRSAAVINNGLRRYVAYSIESEYLVSASVPCVVRLCWWCVGVYVHAYVHTLRGCRLKQDVKAAFMVL